jgi:hypothetical protein
MHRISILPGRMFAHRKHWDCRKHAAAGFYQCFWRWCFFCRRGAVFTRGVSFQTPTNGRQWSYQCYSSERGCKFQSVHDNDAGVRRRRLSEDHSRNRRGTKMRKVYRPPNTCVHASPDWFFIVAQVSAAPDADRRRLNEGGHKN